MQRSVMFIHKIPAFHSPASGIATAAAAATNTAMTTTTLLKNCMITSSLEVGVAVEEEYAGRVGA